MCVLLVQGGAIQLSNEFLWAEADFVHSVLVLNNTINSYSSGMFLGVDPPVRANHLPLPLISTIVNRHIESGQIDGRHLCLGSQS